MRDLDINLTIALWAMIDAVLIALVYFQITAPAA